MPVFRELDITWKGETYKFVPSMKIMRSIEMADVSLADISVRTSQGRPPISHIAFVLAQMLASVGVKVTDEDVYAELISGDEQQVAALITTVLLSFAPADGNAKNPDARTGSQSS